MPLLLYMVKVPDTHLIIGTSAMSVAINALINLAAHASKGNVRWQTGLVVSLLAVMGALAGSQMGKITDGHYITLPFSLLMLVVAGLTLKRNPLAGNPLPSSHSAVHPAIVWPSVLALGGLAGFLGIGGGFLVVPALVWFFASRWLRRWQPHWWSWRPWGYRPAPATPCPKGVARHYVLAHRRRRSGGVVGWHSPSA
ncbi:sulfite exporter TauE/SafE family protein [Serratia ureilytica]